MKGFIIRKDILASFVIIILCLVYYNMSLGLPERSARFPKFAIIVTLLLTILYILTSLLEFYKKETKKKEMNHFNSRAEINKTTI